MYTATPTDYPSWRDLARRLLAAAIPPERVQWGASGLFAEAEASALSTPTAPLSVPRDFLSMAERAACHRDPQRFDDLYRALWRVAHGERHLLQLTTDPLVIRLRGYEKQVRFDAHKTKAFVRFRKIVEDNCSEHYIAWHRPDHFVLPLVAGFFSRRFTDMRWTILTPDASLHWNGAALHWGPGASRDEAPGEDMLEDLWRDYYRSTFNPARIKMRMMKKELPVRHWGTLPESRLIPELLAQAHTRVDTMLAHTEGFAQDASAFFPETPCSLGALREAAGGCKACPLYCDATQTVFGMGDEDADLVLVGEQPGDEEDRWGKPFVGPAGEVLNQALDEAGIRREKIYITNAVKHFKHTVSDGFRRHVTPGWREVDACKPWLMQELDIVKPARIVALGNTAARALIHRGFTMKDGSGRFYESTSTAPVLATYHPSAILRARENGGALFAQLVEHLKRAA